MPGSPIWRSRMRRPLENPLVEVSTSFSRSALVSTRAVLVDSPAMRTRPITTLIPSRPVSPKNS